MAGVELKPCPFCGDKNPKLRLYDYKGWWKMKVTCNNVYCGIGFSAGMAGGGIATEDVEEMTIERWNNRA